MFDTVRKNSDVTFDQQKETPNRTVVRLLKPRRPTQAKGKQQGFRSKSTTDTNGWKNHIPNAREQRQFFKRLCYEPIWEIDNVTNPSELIFAARLGSGFLLKLETGLHRSYPEIVKSFFTIKVFDLVKSVELKQLTKIFYRNEFFSNKKERKAGIKLVDSLPVYFAVRPVCPHCRREMILINTIKLSQMPFWAHPFPAKAAETESIKCGYKQSLWGDFPVLINYGQK